MVQIVVTVGTEVQSG